jgi:hypothetical protein
MKRALKQGTVVLLLALAIADICADLIAPQSCCEWLTEIACALEVSPNADPNDQALDGSVTLMSEKGSDNQHDDSSKTQEDCFCCCSHFLPSHHFHPPTLDPRPPDRLFTDARLPSPPPQTPFHPPRFS